jgi:hypothetical protein
VNWSFFFTKTKFMERLKTRSIGSLLVVIILVFSTQSLFAQNWLQGKRGIYSIGIGASQGFGLYNGYRGVTYSGLSVNASGEYKVHNYVGLGWQTGLNSYFTPYNNRYGAVRTLEIPIAIRANFHILEVTKARVKDRLDVYAGMTLGGGPAFYTGPNASDIPSGDRVYGILHFGPQFGVRFWPVKKVAIFGELGWGVTFANVGVSF